MMTISLSLAAFAIAFADAPTRQDTEPFAVAIEYGDLNLASPADRAEFQYRVEQAASKQCGDWPATTTLSQRRQIDDCKARVRVEAARKIAPEIASAVAGAPAAEPRTL